MTGIFLFFNAVGENNIIEKIIVIEGSINLKINYEWNKIDKGSSYEVKKNREFEVSCENPVAYICYYM